MEIFYESSCQPKGWEGFFNRKDVKAMMQDISNRLQSDSQNEGLGLNPKIGWIFRAFHMVSPDEVKAIIMGQDPAPQPRLATGLSLRGNIDWNLVPLPCKKHASRLFTRKYSDPGFYEGDECEMQPCPTSHEK